MLDHFRAMGPKEWWIIVVGFSRDALDKRNLTQAQKVLFELDSDAYLFLIHALSFEYFTR